MHVEINIRLDVRGRRNSLADCTERGHLALNALRGQFFDVIADRFIDEIVRTNYVELQDNLLVQFDSSADRATTEHVLSMLSDALEQDCIAVYYPEFHRGAIVGSHPEAWGNFSFDKFKRINLQALAA